jgi:type IX secretion system PorP/SprF family membrane protein
MKVYKITLLLLIILSCKANVHGQDVIYSQFYANPIYLNPAIAGSKLSSRLTLNYRMQWPTVSQGYNSISASYDQPVQKLSGAVGVIVNTDVAAGGIYNSLSANGIYAYHLEVSRNILVNAAFQVGFVQHRLDWSKLTFDDQANQTVPSNLNVGRLDFSAGLMAGYKEHVYIGMAVNHLTQPDMSYFEGTANKLDMRITIHAGALFDVREGAHGKELGSLSMSPNIVFEQQGKFKQLNIGIYANSYPLIAGLWLRHCFGNPDAAIVLLGFQQKNYKFEYSFDYTLSRLKIGTGGAHEISLVFLFKNNKTAYKYRALKVTGF